MNDRVIAVLVAALGSAVYFALAFGFWPDVGAERIGTFLYNYYFLALIDGHFDVPLRIVALEGHYDAAGRAYVYHGMAPLITRAIASPFVNLKEVSLAPLTIWLAAVGGTAVYHFLFVQILTRFGAPNTALQRSVGLLLGIMFWFASPGLLLVSNDSFFQEPIAMTYLFVACFLALLAQVVLFQKNIGSVLLPLAVSAGLCVYARPNLAVGLYAGVCVLSLLVLRQKGWRGFAGVAGAMTVLFAFGFAQLIFNELRFGNMFQMHAVPGTGVEIGFVYFGLLADETPRQNALVALDSLNVYRVVPNLMVYLFDLPSGIVANPVERAYRYMTSGIGPGRLETPRIGMVYLWLPWFMLAAAGMRGGTAGLRHAWTPVLATGLGVLLTASFSTLTLRYRIDLWPFLLVLAMLALPRILVVLEAKQKSWARFAGWLGFTSVLSLFMTLSVAYVYAFKILERGLRSRWSFETCAEMVAVKQSLGPDAVARLCGL